MIDVVVRNEKKEEKHQISRKSGKKVQILFFSPGPPVCQVLQL
jgi:hypothetical protein